MTNPTDQQARRRTLHLCLAVALLSLVPHLAQSFDTTNGLRVGASTTINSNTVSTDAAAIGQNNDFGGANLGSGSIAVGNSNGLYGVRNSAFGTGIHLWAPDAMATGSGHSLSGANSFAFGEGNQTGAAARQALAGGHFTIAYGDSSTALGACTSAYSQNSLAVGFWNAPVNNENTSPWAASYWQPGDSLFVVGNGTSSSDRKNALVVTKDGIVTVSNKIILSSAVPAGDIPMYQP